jgi:hypothetical protein
VLLVPGLTGYVLLVSLVSLAESARGIGYELHWKEHARKADEPAPRTPLLVLFWYLPSLRVRNAVYSILRLLSVKLQLVTRLAVRALHSSSMIIRLISRLLIQE